MRRRYLDVLDWWDRFRRQYGWLIGAGAIAVLFALGLTFAGETALIEGDDQIVGTTPPGATTLPASSTALRVEAGGELCEVP